MKTDNACDAPTAVSGTGLALLDSNGCISAVTASFANIAVWVLNTLRIFSVFYSNSPKAAFKGNPKIQSFFLSCFCYISPFSLSFLPSFLFSFFSFSCLCSQQIFSYYVRIQNLMQVGHLRINFPCLNAIQLILPT